MNISFWANLWNKVKYGWDLNQVGTTLLIVPDFSHWSVLKPPKIDEDKFARQCEEKGVKLIIYKGTDSANGQLFTDVTAPFWWGLAQRLGLGTASYHWLQPGVDPTVAFNYHKNYIEEYPTTAPMAMDFEETKITSATDYLWRGYTWLGLADEYQNDKTLVYTAPWYINGHIKAKIPQSDWEKKIGMLRNWPLMVAWYSRYWPKGLWPWEDFVGWQYSDRADYPYYIDEDNYWGTEWGIQSKGLDMSYFRKEWLEKYLPDSKPVEPPEEFPTPETKGLVFRTLYNLRTRSSPTNTTVSNIIGSVERGTEVEALEIGGRDCWIRTDKGWVCKELDGTQYLEQKKT